MTSLKTQPSFLHIFSVELPDPLQQLALQDIHGTFNTFKHFASLPMELQLMIWRGCFPKSRCIELKIGSSCKTPTHKRHSRSCQYAPRRFYQPITLRINRASRQETLRHYQILLRPNGTDSYDNTFFPTFYQELYLNPDRDVLVLNNTSILQYSRYTTYASSWLRQISQLNSNLFASIKYIQIRQWYVSKSKTWHDLYVEGYDTLEKFSGLEEVHLLLDPVFDVRSPFYRRCRRKGMVQVAERWLGRSFDSADVWMSESFIKGIFNRARLQDPAIKLPDVYVCDWEDNMIYKPFLDIIDSDLIPSYPLLQRFLEGDFAAVV